MTLFLESLVWGIVPVAPLLIAVVRSCKDDRR